MNQKLNILEYLINYLTESPAGRQWRGDGQESTKITGRRTGDQIHSTGKNIPGPILIIQIQLIY